MDKRTMQFKLLSYRQALKRAYESDDKSAIISWAKDIADLQRQIEELP